MPENTIRNTYLPNKRKIPATTHLKSLFGWRLLVALGFLLLWMSFYDVKCCCFVLVSCPGYHVRKMYDRNWWNFVVEKTINQHQYICNTCKDANCIKSQPFVVSMPKVSKIHSWLCQRCSLAELSRLLTIVLLINLLMSLMLLSILTMKGINFLLWSGSIAISRVITITT